MAIYFKIGPFLIPLSLHFLLPVTIFIFHHYHLCSSYFSSSSDPSLPDPLSLTSSHHPLPLSSPLSPHTLNFPLSSTSPPLPLTYPLLFLSSSHFCFPIIPISYSPNSSYSPSYSSSLRLIILSESSPPCTIPLHCPFYLSHFPRLILLRLFNIPPPAQLFPFRTS